MQNLAVAQILKGYENEKKNENNYWNNNFVDVYYKFLGVDGGQSLRMKRGEKWLN